MKNADIALIVSTGVVVAYLGYTKYGGGKEKEAESGWWGGF